MSCNAVHDILLEVLTCDHHITQAATSLIQTSEEHLDEVLGNARAKSKHRVFTQSISAPKDPHAKKDTEDWKQLFFQMISLFAELTTVLAQSQFDIGKLISDFSSGKLSLEKILNDNQVTKMEADEANEIQQEQLSKFLQVLGWIVGILTVIITFCVSGPEAAVVAAVVFVLIQSGAFDKMVNAIGDAIGDACGASDDLKTYIKAAVAVVAAIVVGLVSGSIFSGIGGAVRTLAGQSVKISIRIISETASTAVQLIMSSQSFLALVTKLAELATKDPTFKALIAIVLELAITVALLFICHKISGKAAQSPIKTIPARCPQFAAIVSKVTDALNKFVRRFGPKAQAIIMTMIQLLQVAGQIGLGATQMEGADIALDLQKLRAAINILEQAIELLNQAQRDLSKRTKEESKTSAEANNWSVVPQVYHELAEVLLKS